MNQAFGHRPIHQVTSALELCSRKVLTLLQDTADPLFVDAVRPASAEEISESQMKEKIAY